MSDPSLTICRPFPLLNNRILVVGGGYAPKERYGSYGVFGLEFGLVDDLDWLLPPWDCMKSWNWSGSFSINHLVRLSFGSLLVGVGKLEWVEFLECFEFKREEEGWNLRCEKIHVHWFLFIDLEKICPLVYFLLFLKFKIKKKENTN